MKYTTPSLRALEPDGLSGSRPENRDRHNSSELAANFISRDDSSVNFAGSFVPAPTLGQS